MSVLLGLLLDAAVEGLRLLIGLGLGSGLGSGSGSGLGLDSLVCGRSASAHASPPLSKPSSRAPGQMPIGGGRRVRDGVCTWRAQITGVDPSRHPDLTLALNLTLTLTLALTLALILTLA